MPLEIGSIYKQNEIDKQEKLNHPSNMTAPKYADSALNNKLSGDKFEKFDYSIDDGKISFKDKTVNFLKGVVSPITTMFSSAKNFAVGALAIAGGAALIVATGGAAAPVLISLGIAGGALQLGLSAYKAKNATTDEEAKNAWQGIGAGTSTLALSAVGAKSALKTANISTEGLNPISASIKCIKETPSSISKSVNSFKTGSAFSNLGLNVKNAKINKKTETIENTSSTKTTYRSEKPVSGEFWEDNAGMDQLRYEIYEKSGAYELIDEQGTKIKNPTVIKNANPKTQLGFDYDKLDNLKIENFALTTDEQGVRGSCILNKGNKKHLHVLKEAGIEQVIDLRAEGNAAKAAETCSRNGLDYVKFSIKYDEPMTQEEINALPNFIEAVRKGKYYIGCNEGTNRTDVATGIAYIFDPQSKTTPALRSENTIKVLSMLRKACNEILIKDKKTGKFNVSEDYIRQLGWDSLESFFAEFQKRMTLLSNKNLPQ